MHRTHPQRPKAPLLPPTESPLLPTHLLFLYLWWPQDQPPPRATEGEAHGTSSGQQPYPAWSEVPRAPAECSPGGPDTVQPLSSSPWHAHHTIHPRPGPSQLGYSAALEPSLPPTKTTLTLCKTSPQDHSRGQLLPPGAHSPRLLWKADLEEALRNHPSAHIGENAGPGIEA